MIPLRHARRAASRIAQNFLRSRGIRVVRVGKTGDLLGAANGTFLPAISAATERIPGMISVAEGEALYWRAYAQSIPGDIIEIGSWQGRSTIFLAAACRDARNGTVHAIDHFRGNPGKEKHYVVQRDDLSDLRGLFLENIADFGLTDWVVLHEGASEEVQADVKEQAQTPRFLFIDGLHTYDAVLRDLKLYGSLLAPGGIVVLDDFSPSFPGVIRAVRDFSDTNPGFGSPVQYLNTITLRRR